MEDEIYQEKEKKKERHVTSKTEIRQRKNEIQRKINESMKEIQQRKKSEKERNARKK